jgi:hypothetical protein
MTIAEMHYDLKQKLNKIDSQQSVNLRIPEIDWKLNEAQEIFVKAIAEPRMYGSILASLGFETTQRTIEDIRTIVVNQDAVDECLAVEEITGTSSYLAELPEDYWFYVSSNVYGRKNDCTNVLLHPMVIQHDDRAGDSMFDKPSFEWRECNIRFFKDGIRIFTDGTFAIENMCLNYIKKPVFMHNADATAAKTYTDLQGTPLTETKDCELPETCHREIVDIAVAIITGDLQLPDLQTKLNKLKFNQ